MGNPAHFLKLALGLEQDKAVLGKTEPSELHPAMAAFKLWLDETDLAFLGEEDTKVYQSAGAPSARIGSSPL